MLVNVKPLYIVTISAASCEVENSVLRNSDAIIEMRLMCKRCGVRRELSSVDQGGQTLSLKVALFETYLVTV